MTGNFNKNTNGKNINYEIPNFANGCANLHWRQGARYTVIYG